jgi:SpoVK/Ycf46/Vps4 family AAA+-type ATPase
MDSAFERRFLYKIEFNLPEKETRAKIWKNQIPSISEPDAFVLAERYRFSGGQIENISRKFIVDLVLEGIDIDLKRMIQYCDDETLEKTVKPLGFTA